LSFPFASIGFDVAVNFNFVEIGLFLNLWKSFCL